MEPPQRALTPAAITTQEVSAPMPSPTHSTPEQDWRENELVKDHIRQASTEVAASAGRDFCEYLEHFALHPSRGSRSQSLDSPLEVIWLVWWDALCRVNKSFGEWFDIEPQRQVECGGQRYRLDFVVTLDEEALSRLVSGGLSWPLIGVELDGHTFHEKTLEQVTYRNQRDRALQQAGWKIFHYSFSEMDNVAIDCLAEVLCFARMTRQSLLAEAALRRIYTKEGA